MTVRKGTGSSPLPVQCNAPSFYGVIGDPSPDQVLGVCDLLVSVLGDTDEAFMIFEMLFGDLKPVTDHWGRAVNRQAGDESTGGESGT